MEAGLDTELAFDKAAHSYDGDFSETSVGKAQRGQVWKILDKELTKNTSLDILELSCGTGLDAVFMAQKGHKVLATDISGEMIRKAEENTGKREIDLSFRVMDIRDIGDVEGTYDLIFSNFGGLNCLDKNELQNALKLAQEKLKDDGKLIFVLISNFCFMETLYFSVTFRFKKAFRRRKSRQIARLGDEEIELFYYSVKEFDELLGEKHTKRIGIGNFVPPSYMDKHIPKFLINFLNRIDRALLHLQWSSRWSDHVLLEYNMKS